MTIHFITFNIPLPADFGGAKAVMHSLSIFKEIGTKVKLHCFLYGDRVENPSLLDYADEVFYYPRVNSLLDLISFLPFIVKSRQSKMLFERISKDDNPIWMEGVHCTYFTKKLKLNQRKIFLRTHNIESHYYWNLFRNENPNKKKLFFFLEYLKLKFYEPKIWSSVDKIFAISAKDHQFLMEYNPNVHYLPPMDFNQKIKNEIYQGTHEKIALYQADFTISENWGIAQKIMNSWSPDHSIKLVIAGKFPSSNFSIPNTLNPNISIVKSPNDKEMEALNHQAYIHIVWALQDSGFKMKMVDALHGNGHVISNELAISDPRLREIVHISNNLNEIPDLASRLLSKSVNNGEKFKVLASFQTGKEVIEVHLRDFL
jgi:hypothetical protein